MTLVSIIVVTVATVMAWRVNPRSRGMRLFALGLISLCVGGIFGMARVVIPGTLIFAVCNVFMLTGVVCLSQGVRRFRELPLIPGVGVFLIYVVVAVPFTWFLWVDENFGMRVGIISAAFSALCADAALGMARKTNAPLRLTYWPTAFAFGFASLYLAVRAISGLSGIYGESLLVPVRIELISTICANVAYVGCAVGMILASNTQLRQQAEQMALMDPLTGLPNRRRFLDRILAAEEHALSNGGLHGIVYLDLDGFKAVNDHLGHDIGDALLQNVSNAMKTVIRAGDCAARLGGDEFVVLVEGVESRDQLQLLAGRLKSAIETQIVPGTDDTPVRVSIGTALFPDQGSSAHDAMREADAAMYVTKRQTRWAGQAADRSQLA